MGQGKSVDLIREMPLFSGLSDDEFAAIYGRLGRRTFGRGVFIFHKDSPGRALYIVESGRVRLFSISDTGQEVSLNLCCPGEVFGELAVLDGRPRSAGAVAQETTIALSLQREELLPLLQACPRLARNLMELLAARVRYTTRCLEELAFLDVPGRVASRLLDLSRRNAGPCGGLEPEITLTQTELASWVAASRESVNKVLAAFRSGGFIALDGSRITILDRKRLEQQVQY